MDCRCASQCQHCYTLENVFTFESLGVNAFNHSWKYVVSKVFPPMPLVLIVCSGFWKKKSQVD